MSHSGGPLFEFLFVQINVDGGSHLQGTEHMVPIIHMVNAVCYESSNREIFCSQCSILCGKEMNK